MTDELREVWPQVCEFIRHWQTASLATVDEHGHPHAANIWYAAETSEDAVRLFWVSKPRTAHGRHIDVHGLVAMTIYAHVNAASEIHGVQLHAVARMLTPGSEEADHAWSVFGKRYPFIASIPGILARLRSERFYSADVTWLRWVDNRRGFGWKVEGSVGGGARGE